MARRRKKRRRSNNSMKSTAKKLLSLAAFIGPEVGTLLANPNAAGAGQAISLKTGFNPMDGSFDLSRLILGWGPSIGFELGARGATVVKKLLKF